jgi:putative ABC transport system ATP-binding protein
MREETVLEARDVVKVFEEGTQRVEVLKGVSLDVAAGEVVALEGPSGSGKTTLLSIMGCILTPTSGRVRIEGKDVDPTRPEHLREARRRSIGFVFQQYNLFPALTALENVEYSLNVKGVRGDEAHREATRVLARALAGSPRVILADEPTANLDTAVGTQILELFRDLAKSEKTGLVVVTHDPKVRAVADRVVGIRDGLLAA